MLIEGKIKNLKKSRIVEMDMDYDEFYNRFLNDIHGFELDSEKLTKMLIKSIESVVDDIGKMKINHDNCREWKNEIHAHLDAYNRAIGAMCFNLKSIYTQSFDLIDPKKIAEREERDIEFNNKYPNFFKKEIDINSQSPE